MAAIVGDGAFGALDQALVARNRVPGANDFSSPVTRSSVMKSTASPRGWSEGPPRPATPYISVSLKRQPRNCAAVRTGGIAGTRVAVKT